MNGPARRQRGVTLLISLIMLTILTLFASAMIRLSSTNMLIAGNMAAQHALRDVVQRAIETDLSSASFYNDVVTPGGGGCWTGNVSSAVYGSTNCFSGANTNGYSVTLQKPICLTQEIAPGQGALTTDLGTAGHMETFWEVSATGYDTVTGSSVTLTQGVKIIVSGDQDCKNNY